MNWLEGVCNTVLTMNPSLAYTQQQLLSWLDEAKRERELTLQTLEALVDANARLRKALYEATSGGQK